MDRKPKKQEVYICFTGSFESNFFDCFNGIKYLTITSFSEDGHFEGEINTFGPDNDAQPPAGSVKRSVQWKTVGNEIETESGIVDPIQQSSYTSSANNSLTEEKDTNPVEESTTLLVTQEYDGQPQFIRHANAPPNAVIASTVDSSSHSHLPPLSRTTSVLTSPATDQKASDQGTAHTSTVDKGEDHKLTEKRITTVHWLLHGLKEKFRNDYDEEFAEEFDKFLNQDLDTSQASANNEDNIYLKYIEKHLKSKKCPLPCSRLWKFCIDNKLFHLFKYAPEGLLVHSSSRPNLVGTVDKTYFGYRKVSLIGCGGFGNVYKYTEQTAVKEEFKRPLIMGNTELFQQIMGLNHPHVISVAEYVAGPPYSDKDGNTTKCFLSVMSFKNQVDLQKQFKEEGLTCVLDYMIQYRDQEKFIFRNYTTLFRNVFDGLCYLKSKGIVHRDIKPSNILVHQYCNCASPLQCVCASNNEVAYLLGDMDLLSLEEYSTNLTYTCEEWKKMACRDPAGTIGMKPPESFFRDEDGKHVTSHKSDVWSACVTMMNVLISKAANSEALIEIGKFIKAATEGTKTATKSVSDSSNLLESILTKFESVLDQMKSDQCSICSGLVNIEMSDLGTNLKNLKELLANGQHCLQQQQSFQGGFNEVYKEENPLAEILATAYGAQVLHWKCLKKLPHVYNTPLWTVMRPTLDVIVAGIKFVPDRRQDAMELVKSLEEIPLVDCSDSK